MAIIDGCLLLPLLYLAALIGSSWRYYSSAPEESLSRHSFPADFVFGTSTSAYQIEGAANEGGRGPSIWDTYTQQHPEKIADRSNGSVAIDFYHRFKGDVRMMKNMGVDAYRFSISWSRLLPNGNISGGINKEGVQYYNDLIDELKLNGIDSYVTIFHWDVPQALEDQYGGFLSLNIVYDFEKYSELCFQLFGDRVKHWITINDPLNFCQNGYSWGINAPGRCSSWERGKCSSGDSGREPYIVAHHLLLAHAAVVKVYKDKYQASQKGKIGMIVATDWVVPYSDTKSDKDAARREMDFTVGWFMDPLTHGEYPSSMKAIVGDRLPQFTKVQSEMLRGSSDFIGINYYSTVYAKSSSSPTVANYSYSTDSHVSTTGERNGIPIGPRAGSRWLYIYPPGIRDVLLYIKRKYKLQTIYVTENGVDEFDNATMTVGSFLKDDTRIGYYREHLHYLKLAMRDGVNVKGFFAWTMFDNFEWGSGFTLRFGLYYVDYKNLERYPKNSAHWFREFLR